MGFLHGNDHIFRNFDHFKKVETMALGMRNFDQKIFMVTKIYKGLWFVLAS